MKAIDTEVISIDNGVRTVRALILSIYTVP